MDKKLEVIEDVFIVCGVALSIDQIKTILGIVLLVIQIGLILYKGIKLIIGHVKKKNYNEAISTIEEMTKEVQDVIDKTDKDGKRKDSE